MVSDLGLYCLPMTLFKFPGKNGFREMGIHVHSGETIFPFSFLHYVSIGGIS